MTVYYYTVQSVLITLTTLTLGSGCMWLIPLFQVASVDPLLILFDSRHNADNITKYSSIYNVICNLLFHKILTQGSDFMDDVLFVGITNHVR